MSPNPDDLFEGAKKHADNEQWDEAINKLTRAVHLQPNNAAYHAWLASAFRGKKEYPKAMASAIRAIQLDPLCGMAYRQRGHVLRESRKNYAGAIEHYSRAIEIDPNDASAFGWRGNVYYALDDYENALVDKAQHYRLSSDWKEKAWSGRGEEQVWYRTIHQHLTKSLFPRLKVGPEKYVVNMPCFMTWGKRSAIHSHGGDAYTMTYSRYGSGYVCLTDRNIHLFSFGQISQKFPLFNKGFFANFLSSAISKTTRSLEKTDQAWTVPYQTVSGAQMSDQAIQLVTPAMTWEIYEHYAGHLPEILAGINLGVSGRFAARETTPKSSTTVQQPSTDIVGLLKQLGELKAQGVITDAEFDQKKKELLARL